MQRRLRGVSTALAGELSLVQELPPQVLDYLLRRSPPGPAPNTRPAKAVVWREPQRRRGGGHPASTSIRPAFRYEGDGHASDRSEAGRFRSGDRRRADQRLLLDVWHRRTNA